MANVRRYKGARSVAEASAALHPASLDAAGFAEVGPDYIDDVEDVTHRSSS